MSKLPDFAYFSLTGFFFIIIWATSEYQHCQQQNPNNKKEMQNLPQTP